jgi:ubiquinone/menaquinone biosynthesis C-methylase UbiE
MATSISQPSPLLFFDTVTAYQRTAILKAAVELSLFTAIGEGNTTAGDIARRCEASERGVRTLCDSLATLGMLTKSGSDYGLTQDSAVFLNGHSPAYIGGAVEFLVSPTLIDAFSSLTEAVRKGGTALPGDGTVSEENPVWVPFARGMAPLMAMPAGLLARLVLNGSTEKMRVLDIAAGHGMFGIAFAQQNPQAEVVALDWASVLEVAQENAERAGVAERHKTVPGNAFETDFGSDNDIVLLTNFLHHFDKPTCETLLRKLHASLKDGGRVATLEFVPNDDRISPPSSAMFSAVMLATTRGGDAYTFKEFEEMFKNAGFSRTEFHELPPAMEQVLISHK